MERLARSKKINYKLLHEGESVEERPRKCQLKTPTLDHLYEVHRLVHVNDGIEVPQDIVYDEEEQTVVITVAPVSEMTSLVPSINFHDYKTGYVAFKDVTATKCYLSYPPIPFPSPVMYRMKKTKMLLPSTASISDNVMSPDDVYKLAGERIHDFCLDYDTYWMDLTPGMPQARGKRAATSASFWGGCWFYCGICIVYNEEIELASLQTAYTPGSDLHEML